MAENKEVRSVSLNEKEIDLIKRTFKGAEYLLKSVRAVFFGADVSAEDRQALKKLFADDEVKEAVRKKMYPLLKTDNVPIGQVADFWMGTESHILGASRDTIHQAVASKEKVLKMLTQSFDNLTNPKGELVSLEYSAESIELDPLQIGLLARNLYIRSVETGLNFVKLTAEQITETPAQTKARTKKDSNE